MVRLGGNHEVIRGWGSRSKNGENEERKSERREQHEALVRGLT